MNNRLINGLIFGSFLVLGLGGCTKGFEAAQPGNLTSGSLSNPPGGTTQNRQKIQIAASDNVGVTKVEVYINAVLQPQCVFTSKPANNAPYECEWPVVGNAGDQVQILAKAYDANGNVGTSAPSVVTLQ
jgi:hypothetical protein